ncbi:hypothetical protein M8J76_000328 [Diaphorina citri]|nr:hypothetical protein M8J76_000328 [Diaphorina citri]
MVLGISAMFVVTVAEFSSFLSILAVLLCFFAMFLLIVRNMTVFWLHGEEIMFGSSVHTVQQKIPQMKMMKVHIPFTFKLQETSRSSFSDIQCTVSSQVPYTLQVLWGVSIRELHLFLWRPWSMFVSAVQNDVLPPGLYQHKGICIKETCHNEKTIMLSIPENNLELGRPPRLCYPLVILLTRRDPCNLHPNEPVALVNVVHIKDAVCTLPTNILAQYLKQANGQLSSLKQLYLATGNPSPSSYEDSTETARLEASAMIEQQLCVVCQTSPLSRALLPCRHTCICATCFTKLNQCPMCRSQIKSYFCVRPEDYLSQTPGAPCNIKAEGQTGAPPDNRSWLRLRHRITNLIRSAER